MGYRTRQKILLAKEESEYGSDPTPTVGDNAIDAEEIKVNYQGEVLERGLQRESLSPVRSLVGQRWIEVSFTCELKGSGSAGTAPAIGDLLEACGFSESVDEGSSVVYAPASVGHKSITIYVYDVQTASSGNYRLHKITGARGNVNIVMEAGQIAKLEFTFQGKYNLPTDESDPGNASYESTTPPVVDNSTFTINSSDAIIAQALNLDMGNEVVKRPDITSSGGIAGFEIVARKPNGAFNPEALLVATYDFWSDWTAATERALSILIGSAAGNKATIAAPKITLDNIAEGDRDGIRIEDIPYRCGLSSGDDEVTITFE